MREINKEKLEMFYCLIIAIIGLFIIFGTDISWFIIKFLKNK